MNIKTIAFIAMTLMALTSCNKKAAKDNHPQKEEAKIEVFRPEVLLGDSIKVLLNNNTLLYNTQAGPKYVLKNNKFANIEFDAVEINCGKDQSDIIRSIGYGMLVNKANMNQTYTQILSFLKEQYGEPNKESHTRSANNVAEFTVAAWDCQKYYLCISATAPKNELRGSLIVLFTIPEDYEIFKTLFN